MTKNSILILALIMSYNLSAQILDINIKKGYAVSGYDLVAYFSDNPQKGTEEYMYEYEGVKYKFSSAENRDRFIADPQKFLPQYGGYCAYAMAVSSKKVSVNPETYEIRNNRLYLFYNSGRNNTLVSWLSESPEDLEQKANDNWEKVKWLRQ